MLKFSSCIQNRYKHINGPSHITYVTQWSVGGKDYVNHFLRNVAKMIDSQPANKKIVIAGCSRGSATIIVGLSLLGEKYQNRISLETPFDTLPNVIDSWPTLRYLSSMQLAMLSGFTNYDCNQLSPYDALGYIPDNIPIAYITSKTDQKIS